MLEEYTICFVPTDVSFNLAQIMDENLNVFKLKTVFPKVAEVNTTRISISIDLQQHIMVDKKIKDKDLSKDLVDSKSYTIKSLYGIPNTFQRVIKGL